MADDPVAQLTEEITTWLATAFGLNLTAPDQMALADLITNSALFVLASRPEPPSAMPISKPVISGDVTGEMCPTCGLEMRWRYYDENHQSPACETHGFPSWQSAAPEEKKSEDNSE
jgi:hypothetical protein